MLVVISETIGRFGVGLELCAVTVVAILGNYVLYWCFAFRLPETEAPSKPNPEYVRKQMHDLSKYFGKPLLWLLIIASSAMSIMGLASGLLTGHYVFAFLGGGFFGLCSFVFVRLLKRARITSNPK
jgi:hypothetical protein